MTVLNWRKSSRSANSTSACVEVAWRRSSRSANGTGNCVEVARSGAMLVRDSKNPAGPVLRFPTTGWHAFLAILGTRG